MNEKHSGAEEAVQIKPVTPPVQDNRNAKEKLYDKIPITVKTLDKIIFALFVLLAAAFVLGILSGHGFG